MVTVLRFSVSAVAFLPSSRIDLNFLEPFFRCIKKFSIVSQFVSESSFFRSLFLAEIRAVCSRIHLAAVSSIPSSWNSSRVFIQSPAKQLPNINVRIAGLKLFPKKLWSSFSNVSGPLVKDGLEKI